MPKAIRKSLQPSINKVKSTIKETTKKHGNQKQDPKPKTKGTTNANTKKTQTRKGNGGAQVKNNKSKLKCGQLGSFAELGDNSGYDGHQRDHIPSKAALLETAKKLNKGRDLIANQINAIINTGNAIAIPAKAHQKASRTYGGRNSRNNRKQIIQDAKDLAKAARRDVDTMRKNIGTYNNHCKKAYHKASQEILDKFKTHKDYEKFLEKILNENK